MARKYIQLEEPPLFQAIAYKDREHIRDLLQKGSEVNERIPAIGGCKVHAGATALMVAAEIGDLGIVCDLLAAGADVNAAIAPDAGRKSTAFLPPFRDQNPPFPENSAAEPGWTALMLAANAGHAEVVATLLEAGADQQPQNPRGETALSLALNQGHDDVAKLLRGAGAEEPGPAVRLIQALRRADAVQALAALANGADPDTRDVDPVQGRIPAILLAAQAGLSEAVEALLTTGALVDAATENDRPLRGRTALMAAAAGGHTEVVRRLLRGGANPEAQEEGTLQEINSDRSGYQLFGSACRSTALMLAAERGHAEAARALITGGADVNARTSGPLPTALMRAVRNGHHETIKVLLEAGADLTAATRDETPLTLAVSNSDHHAMDLLLDAGADPNLKPKDDDGPFWVAVVMQDIESARRLIDAGANIEKRGRDRQTPREHLAELSQYGDKEAAPMLEFLNTYSPTSPKPQAPAPAEPAPRDLAAEENRPDRGVAYIDVDAEGIGTINTGIEEDLLLLVKAPVEEVARAFQKIRGARRWEPNAQGQKVTWDSDIYSVFRFKDQAWTIVRHEANERPVPGHDVTVEDARALSHEIGTEVILHDLGADAERIGYRWFRSGNLTESFGAGPNHPDDSKEHWGEPVRFRSETRTVEDLEAIDPLAFVDRFLRDRDAFVPALAKALEGLKKQGVLQLPGVEPEEIERLDIVVP